MHIGGHRGGERGEGVPGGDIVAQILVDLHAHDQKTHIGFGQHGHDMLDQVEISLDDLRIVETAARQVVWHDQPGAGDRGDGDIDRHSHGREEERRQREIPVVVFAWFRFQRSPRVRDRSAGDACGMRQHGGVLRISILSGGEHHAERAAIGLMRQQRRAGGDKEQNRKGNCTEDRHRSPGYATTR